MFTVPGADGCGRFVDGVGNVTLLKHQGTEPEASFAKDGTLPDPENATNPDFECVLQLVGDSISLETTSWTRIVQHCNGCQ